MHTNCSFVPSGAPSPRPLVVPASVSVSWSPPDGGPAPVPVPSPVPVSTPAPAAVPDTPNIQRQVTQSHTGFKRSGKEKAARLPHRKSYILPGDAKGLPPFSPEGQGEGLVRGRYTKTLGVLHESVGYNTDDHL